MSDEALFDKVLSGLVARAAKTTPDKEGTMQIDPAVRKKHKRQLIALRENYELQIRQLHAVIAEQKAQLTALLADNEAKAEKPAPAAKPARTKK